MTFPKVGSPPKGSGKKKKKVTCSILIRSNIYFNLYWFVVFLLFQNKKSHEDSSSSRHLSEGRKQQSTAFISNKCIRLLSFCEDLPNKIKVNGIFPNTLNQAAAFT